MDEQENMKFTPSNYFEAMTKSLHAKAAVDADPYGHSGGRGDAREEVVRKWIQEIVPPSVSICKGEIVDSYGMRSSEWDVVLYTRSPSVWAFGGGASPRRIVPAEEVLALLEIKTRLDEAGLQQTSDAIAETRTLGRHYWTTDDIRNIGLGHGRVRPEWDRVIRLDETLLPIGRVTAGIFAFDGPSTDTLAEWLDRLNLDRYLSYVLVLGKYYVERSGDSDWVVYNLGDLSLMRMAAAVAALVEELDRWSEVRPEFMKYHDLADAELNARTKSKTNGGRGG